MRGRKLHNPLLMLCLEHHVIRHHERVRMALGAGGKGPFELAGSPRLDAVQLHPKHACFRREAGRVAIPG